MVYFWSAVSTEDPAALTFYSGFMDLKDFNPAQYKKLAENLAGRYGIPVESFAITAMIPQPQLKSEFES
jgi:hypothetical protein